MKHIRILGDYTHNFLTDLSYIASLREAYISATIGFQTFRSFLRPLKKKKLFVFISRK
jgi:hypothetical protein